MRAHVDGGLSNVFLSAFMECFGQAGIFKGCLSIDELPYNPVHTPYSFIINLDPRGSPGLHFVCIFQSSARELPCYFDSLGPWNPKVPLPLIRFFHHQSGGLYFYNSYRYQSMNSLFCGYYALAFCLWMEKKKTFGEFLNQLTPVPVYDSSYQENNSCRKNDRDIIKILKKLI